MSAVKLCAELRSLRRQPTWTLLAADKAPIVIALLQTVLLDSDKVLPSSALHERVLHQMTLLRGLGEELDRSPQAYIAEWLTQGWLVRRFPPGAVEEEYELSSDAMTAIRYMQSVMKPRSTATESRLQTVIQQLSRLAHETNANPERRMEALLEERRRIDQEIDEVSRGEVKTIADERALERAREIITLADDLTRDFRRVRDAFANLAKELRQSLVEGDSSRSQVLEHLFEGIDVIAESEAGRTFQAFWRLLTDPVESTLLQESVREIIARPFSRELDRHERRFLTRLTTSLAAEGGAVQDVQQNLARNLRGFVQSRDFLEQRRLHGLLQESLKTALQLKEQLRPNSWVNYTLTLSHASIRSISQVRPDDPLIRSVATDMEDAPPSELDLEVVAELLKHSEIDFRALRAHIRNALTEVSQISVADLLQKHPAQQGLGTVVGYVALGVKYGEVLQEKVQVAWLGLDGVERTAFMPTIYFLRERTDAFA